MRRIHLSQSRYANELLDKFKMSECKPADTPICPPDVKSVAEEVTNFPYRAAVGGLLYLSAKTRPDLSFAVGYESRFQENPKNTDVNNVKRTLRFIQGTKDRGIQFKSGGDLNSLVLYCDPDYASDETRKSTTGYICYLNGAPISWCSRRQSIVSLSSTEAEFIAAAESVKEVLYLKNLLSELTGIVPKIGTLES